MSYSNSNDEHSIEEQFEKIYPQYDYSLESTYREKDMRKRKRMKTMD
ncbi:hypothetical protein [Nitrosopumilus oxyclinae]|nr:hypothetical protein [Nitrosopumilus oxyclinae]